MDTYQNQLTTITSTFFYDDECDNCKNPTFVNKELSTSIIMDTIRESISSQYLHTFGAKPHYSILENLVVGFVLFNLHKNKNMLKSKDELLKYINNNSVSLEEKSYFTDIFLYNQRPKFLSFDEHEYIRCRGNIDGYYKGCLDDGYKYDNIEIDKLLDSIENTVSILSNKCSTLIAK